MRNIIFISAVALASVPAFAQQGPTPGCYAREYTQSHLASHPDQVVKAMALLIQDQSYETSTDRYAYLVVDFADQGHVKRAGLGAQRLDQSLVCFKSSDGRDGCAVDCDGGSFFVTKETGSTMTISTSYLMIGDTEGCGGAIDMAEHPMTEVKYRLNRVDPEICLSKVEN